MSGFGLLPREQLDEVDRRVLEDVAAEREREQFAADADAPGFYPCFTCGSIVFWESKSGTLTCFECHPPTDENLFHDFKLATKTRLRFGRCSECNCDTTPCAECAERQEEEMARISDVFSSRFLKTEDLQGRERTLVIERGVIEEIGQEKQAKPILFFRNAKKGLVLNKTKASVITAVYGDDMDAWPGKSVTLFPSNAVYQGKTVPAIGLRIAVAAPVQPSDTFAADDEPLEGDRPFD